MKYVELQTLQNGAVIDLFIDPELTKLGIAVTNLIQAKNKRRKNQ